MSYLLESFTEDDLLLLIGAVDCHGERPEPYGADYDVERWGTYGTLQGQPLRTGPGYCWLNMTDNLMALYRGGFIYEDLRQYHVIHLTWKGWDRVLALRAEGAQPPSVRVTDAMVAEEREDIARVREKVRRRTVRPRRRSWWRRALAFGDQREAGS